MYLDYEYFYSWVKLNLGLDLNAYKDAQMQRRIASIMKKSGASNFKEYALLIKNDMDIRNKFLDHVTINVTEFYRNIEMFKKFESVLLLDIFPKFDKVRIWSAACSNGSEPYTVGMILSKNKLLNRSTIMATDIDDNMLHKAREGIYSEKELIGLTDKDISIFFEKLSEGYKVKDDIKRGITFKKHNLLSDRYDKGFHVIICRNVTIYFKNDIRDDIYRKFSEALVPGGILFIGATESMFNPAEFGFTKISTSLYQKNK